MKYEIINPSDEAYIDADDFEVAAVACIAIGEGQYGFKPETGGREVPLLLFGSGEKWTQQEFGCSVSDLIARVLKDKNAELVKCLRSARLARERTSINDFTAYAHGLADQMERRAKSAPSSSAPGEETP